MGETTASNPALQVSISFGRFENDSLSWERWSSFSPNKYLEEVEKCATPGSVAQKKAYFEAHYKKIAARKAELLAQENQTETDSFSSGDQSGIDLNGNTRGTDSEFGVSNPQVFNESIGQEISTVGEIRRSHEDDLKEEVSVSADYKSSSVVVEKKELESRSNISHQIGEPEEDVCIKQEESINIEAEDVKEIAHVVYKEVEKATEVEEDAKLDHPKESKVTSVNRENNAAKTKKKSSLPKTKASPVSTPRSSKPTSTPRSSKPTSTPTKALASTTSTKKGVSPSLSRRQVTSSGETKKVANRSLHMSMSLGPSNPSPAPQTTMRKSLIMESMGDKDIVKRAFKTFQNNLSQPKTSADDKPLVKKQVPSRGTMSKVPTTTTLRKENGRPTKVESMDKKSVNAVRTTLVPKSDLRVEKGKESSRKIAEKPNLKEVARTRLQTKLKEEKEAEMKKIKHDFKATPLSTSHRGQKVSKSQAEKANSKTDNSR